MHTDVEHGKNGITLINSEAWFSQYIMNLSLGQEIYKYITIYSTIPLLMDI